MADYYAFLVSFIQSSLIVPAWEDSGCPCGAAICAAGAAVYLGGSLDDVKTGAVNPCATGTAMTSMKKNLFILCNLSDYHLMKNV